MCVEVAWILCVERLLDFSQSLRLHDLFFWRLHDFFWLQDLFYGKVACFFLLRACMIFCAKGLHDVDCEEVLWFFVWRVFFSKKKSGENIILWTTFFGKKKFFGKKTSFFCVFFWHFVWQFFFWWKQNGWTSFLWKSFFDDKVFLVTTVITVTTVTTVAWLRFVTI